MRESSKGLSRGQMDKLARRVQRRLDNKVPRELWSKDEIMYDAFYITGGACPSSGAIQNMQPND